MPRLLVAALAAALALLAAGCGTSRRESVGAYFRKVDDVQAKLAPQVGAANIAYRQFSKAATSAKERAALARAERTIRTMRRRIAAVDPPKDAKPIRRDVLRLLDAEVAFAHDVLRLARYTPRFAAVLADAGRRGSRLQQNLKGAAASQQATAFGAYAKALDHDVARLRQLFPPDVVAPAHRAEVATLQKTARLCRQIRDALHTGGQVTLVGLINQLTALSSTAVRRRVHAAQVRAVRTFNGRLLAMNRLSARIQRERLSLERKL